MGFVSRKSITELKKLRVKFCLEISQKYLEEMKLSDYTYVTLWSYNLTMNTIHYKCYFKSNGFLQGCKKMDIGFLWCHAKRFEGFVSLSHTDIHTHILPLS